MRQFADSAKAGIDPTDERSPRGAGSQDPLDSQATNFSNDTAQASPSKDSTEQQQSDNVLIVADVSNGISQTPSEHLVTAAAGPDAAFGFPTSQIDDPAPSATGASHGQAAAGASIDVAPLADSDGLVNVTTSEGGVLARDVSDDTPSLGEGASSWHGHDTAPLDAAPLADSDGLIHLSANDGPIWFNDTDGNLQSVDGSVRVDGSVSSDVADIAYNKDLGSFNVGSSGTVVADLAAASSSHADAFEFFGETKSVAGSTTFTDSSNPASYSSPASTSFDAALHDAFFSPHPPHSAASDTPILAHEGDLGDGVGLISGSAGSAGTGTSGSGGTQTTTTGASAGLTIDINWDSSVANAPSGFVTTVNQVASYLESEFSDPITITIDVGYGEVGGTPLGSGALGESSTNLISVSYSQLQSALVKNANAIGDSAAAASLPASSPVSGTYWVPIAEANALGLSTLSVVDGFVGISSSYNFTYNDSNGVAAGTFDLFGVLAHEFTEVMGRQMMDGQSFAGAAGYEPLDLFHYSAPGVHDFSGTTTGYFSPDGGTTNLGNFNTNAGGDFGDWAGSVGANAFLAFSNSGVVNPVTAADLTEMNLLGLDPASSSGSPPVVTIHLTQDTGSSSSDHITSNPALSGTADPNAVVTLTEGSTVIATTTANASGNWSYTPTGLAQGAQTVVASETNAAGVTGSSSLTFTLESTPPTVTVGLTQDTGSSSSDHITSNPALSGTADPNAVVTLTEGSTVIATTTANASGNWSYTPTGLAQGAQTVVASETNAAGVTGSSSLTFTLESTPPTVTVGLTQDTGSSSSDHITSNPALSGTADPNAVVTLTEGSTVIATTTANASGNWSYTPTGLAQGAQTVVASETNAAGVTGSSSLTFTLESTPPTVTVGLTQDTGSSSSDHITSNPALSGTADPNAVVTLTEGSTVIATTTANASGNWSYTPTGLAQGAQTVVASETNAAGVTGSSSLTFTLESTPPTVTVGLTQDTGSSSSDHITSNPALSGTADPNAVVTLTEGSTVIATTTANASGNWSYTPTGLAQGAQTVVASETNAAGVTGSSSLTFTLESTPPTVTVGLTQDTGSSSSDHITSNPALSGTADPNAVVTLTEGSTVIATTTANASGNWSYTPTGLAQGAQTVVASETNAAGVTGSSSLTFTLESTPPAAPVITSDTVNSNGQVALNGTAVANSTVTIYDGTAVVGTTLSDGIGSWQFTTPPETGGAHSLTATVTDAAGNVSALSNLVDPVVAAPPVVTIALTQDTGSSSSDHITSNPALSGTADPNAVVTLTEGSTVIATTTANASGNWSYTPTGLAQGAQTVVASETNAAGVIGSASLTFALDTTPPTVTSEVVSGTGISSGAGMLAADSTAVFTLTLSEAVTVTGATPTLALNDGGTATYDAAHSTSTSLAFDYTVAAGQYTNALAVTGVNLNGATVTDAAGNVADLSGADTTFSKLLVDATTPAAHSYFTHGTYSPYGSTNSISVSSAQAATKGVLAGNSDANPADVLSVSAVNGSAANVGHAVTDTYGSLTLNSDGSFVFTDNASALMKAGVGEDFFNYTVSNGHGGTVNETMTVLIVPSSYTYVSASSGSTVTAGSNYFVHYVLDGSNGNAHLNAGSSGSDWLVGGPGDTLTGGNSTDTFMFAPNFGNETINNFNTSHDVIDLPASMVANFAALQADMHASGANTVITLDAHDTITMTNMTIAHLTANNFHFIV